MAYNHAKNMMKKTIWKNRQRDICCNFLKNSFRQAPRFFGRRLRKNRGKNDLNIEYVAGFFDGEGGAYKHHIGKRIHKQSYDSKKLGHREYKYVYPAKANDYHWRVSFWNTHRGVLEEIQLFLQCGKISISHRAGVNSQGIIARVDCYRLVIENRSDVLRVGKLLLPFSIVKKKVLEEMVNDVNPSDELVKF